ncbi:uncharacterized protein LOC144348016 [Saccoglossus kowalevskii]
MGPKMYALLRNLLSPDRPTDKTFDQVVDILEKHLSPKPLIIAERFRFFKRDQHVGESVNSYVAEFRRLAKSCDFGNYLNDALRDRLVCGLRMDAIQKRLLREDKIALNTAIEIAVDKDQLEVKGQARVETSINKVNHQG